MTHIQHESLWCIPDTSFHFKGTCCRHLFYEELKENVRMRRWKMLGCLDFILCLLLISVSLYMVDKAMSGQTQEEMGNLSPVSVGNTD